MTAATRRPPARREGRSPRRPAQARRPARPLKIVIVSAFYSEGMGYSENCLSRALARLGHDVHVITSTFNVYGNEPMYADTYEQFLGPARVAPGTLTVDGYTVHRLESGLRFGYVSIKGLLAKIRELSPDIVHSLEIASLEAWELALARPFLGYHLFTETHQTLTVMRPYMLRPTNEWFKRAVYRLTRTLPTALASVAVERCYAVTPDCGDVARRFYGVPASKLELLSLGADTETFHPIETDADRARRDELRSQLGFGPDDVVCVYSGRFTEAKNPLVLAQAVDRLSATDGRFKSLFVGNGVQRDAIVACRSATVVPFMTHQRLAELYRAADIAVWPRQESISQIDAAASGLPVIVSDRIGETDRVAGNGAVYEQDNVEQLAETIRALSDPATRRSLGAEGRRKMLAGFNWSTFARTIEADFRAALHA